MLRHALTAVALLVGVAGVIYGESAAVSFASGWILGAHILRSDLPWPYALAIVIAWSSAFALFVLLVS